MSMRKVAVASLANVALVVGALPAAALVIYDPANWWSGTCSAYARFWNFPQYSDYGAQTAETPGMDCGQMSVYARFYNPPTGTNHYAAVNYSYSYAHVVSYYVVNRSYHQIFAGTPNYKNKTV